MTPAPTPEERAKKLVGDISRRLPHDHESMILEAIKESTQAAEERARLAENDLKESESVSKLMIADLRKQIDALAAQNEALRGKLEWCANQFIGLGAPEVIVRDIDNFLAVARAVPPTGKEDANG